MSETYRVMALVGPETLELQERRYGPPRPGWVWLRVCRVGVCGTDLALWQGSYPTPLPLVPGHEVVGEVIAVGSGVDHVAVGDRVVPEINATCLARGDEAPCVACTSGLERHCQRRTVVGIIEHDGGFAERMEVPAGCLHRVPEGLSTARAAFVEPVAAALQTFEMAGDPRDLSVVVLGPGRLGTLIVAVARDLGARVAAVARTEASRARALRFGAHAVFDPTSKEDIIAWSGGLGADVVVEVTGWAAAVDAALDLVRPRGTIAVKSTPGTPPTVDLTRLVVDEVRLVGSRCGSFTDGLAWLQETAWPIETLVEACFELEETDAAFRAARGRAKVVVEP